MKKIFLASFVLVTSFCFAQTPGTKVDFKQGQKIIVQTTTKLSSAASVMGQEVESTADTYTEDLLEVVSVAKNNNIVTKTLKKMKLNANAMGQETKYDSEKPEDKTSQVGESLGKLLNKPQEYTLNDEGIISKVPAEENNQSSNMMMGNAGINNEVVDGELCYRIINRKIGSTWTDSITKEGLKTVSNYIVKSIENNIATVEVKGTTTGTTTIEQMGQEMTMTANNTLTGLILIDITTGLKKSTIINIAGNSSIDAMGMSIPVTIKSTTTVEYILQN